MEKITLYQFQLCPFCHKVRAALELKGLDYDKVEVAPGTKKQLPELPEEAPRKVPVLQVGDRILWDSTTILKAIDQLGASEVMLLPADEAERGQAIELEDWIDENLIPSIPTVIYRTWGDSFKAARLTAQGSNFTTAEALKVRVGGSLIMKMIAKRILKRHGKADGPAWFTECVAYLEDRLEPGPFLLGETLTIADAALHGAIRCVEAFPLFEELMQRPTLRAWYERIDGLRAASWASAAE